MAVVIWFTIGLALWHFTVFLPDRFKGGIIGAFLGSVAGAMITGALWQLATGDSVGQTDVLTVLAAVPGSLAGMAVCWMLGEDLDEDPGTV